MKDYSGSFLNLLNSIEIFKNSCNDVLELDNKYFEKDWTYLRRLVEIRSGIVQLSELIKLTLGTYNEEAKIARKVPMYIIGLPLPSSLELNECEECSKKPGSHTLCIECLERRDLIRKLQYVLREAEIMFLQKHKKFVDQGAGV